MELAGERIIKAPRPHVWAAINDLDTLSRCIPGCEELSAVSDTERQARVALKIGPVRARFSGRLLMSDIAAPASCRMRFEGSGGAAGFAQGETEVSLTDEGPQTRLRYTVCASVGGKLGQIGSRLIDASAKRVADEFFTALDCTLADDSVGSGGQSGSMAPAAPVPATAGHAGPSMHTAPRPNVSAPLSDGWAGELSRAFWFCLGVATTLLLSHVLR